MTQAVWVEWHCVALFGPPKIQKDMKTESVEYKFYTEYKSQHSISLKDQLPFQEMGHLPKSPSCLSLSLNHILLLVKCSIICPLCHLYHKLKLFHWER